MTDAIHERPTSELRWSVTGVLEQKWHIQNLAFDSQWTVKEEWRAIPNAINDPASSPF